MERAGSVAYLRTGEAQPSIVVEQNEHAGMNQQVKAVSATAMQGQSDNSRNVVNPSLAEVYDINSFFFLHAFRYFLRTYV